MERIRMNSDFKDLLRIFAEENVEFLVVGAYAVIHHTQPRYTNLREDHVEGKSEGVTVPFLGVPQIIAAKTLAGRPQDLADIDELRRAGKSLL